jgi:hypothetical protein
MSVGDERDRVGRNTHTLNSVNTKQGKKEEKKAAELP